LSELTL